MAFKIQAVIVITFSLFFLTYGRTSPALAPLPPTPDQIGPVSRILSAIHVSVSALPPLPPFPDETGPITGILSATQATAQSLIGDFGAQDFSLQGPSPSPGGGGDVKQINDGERGESISTLGVNDGVNVNVAPALSPGAGDSISASVHEDNAPQIDNDVHDFFA